MSYSENFKAPNETKKNRAIYGVFKDRLTLEATIDALKESGFRNADISILLPRGEDSNDEIFAHEKTTKAPEGAAAGAVGGSVIGGVFGWLAGIGLLAIPGFGVFIAAGPVVSALSGAGIFGALGGLTGGLVGIGIPEYEAKKYEAEVRAGGMLLAVHVDNMHWAEKAESTLKAFGADRVSEGRETKGPTLDYQTGKSDHHTPSRFVS